MKILALTTVYPSPSEPQKAPYVRTRLQHLAGTEDIRLLVPTAAVDYGNPHGRLFENWHLPTTYRDEQIEVRRRRWFYLPRGGGLNGFFLFIQLLPLVSEIQSLFPFEVICADFAHPEGVAAAMLGMVFSCPFTITMRGNELQNNAYWLRRKLMGWAFRRAARVFALSEELRDLAVRLGAPPEKAVFLPNGVYTDVFHPRDRAECRRKHGIDPDEAVILSAGQLRELKGFHHIASCIKGLRESGIPARLIIAGGPSRADRFASVLKEKVAHCGAPEAITFAGDVSQETLAELMCAADVFCLASSREGWPNVVNEALACGTPVVSTDVGAVRKLLPSSEYGIIVPVHDNAALEHALATALSCEWNHKAIACWGGKRSWDKVADELRRHLHAISGDHGH